MRRERRKVGRFGLNKKGASFAVRGAVWCMRALWGFV
jgi:hypothetical protein